MSEPLMKVEWWINEGYFEGGCWALILGNRLFLEAAGKGRNKLVEKRLRRLAALWNADDLKIRILP